MPLTVDRGGVGVYPREAGYRVLKVNAGTPGIPGIPGVPRCFQVLKTG